LLVGKSSLAHALTASGPFLELQGGQLPLIDLAPALENYGLDANAITGESGWRQLARLVTKHDGPEFVVLDNLNNISELQGKLPRVTKSVVVATCREWSSAAPEWYGRIDVGGMTPSEASDLVGALLPSLSSEARNSAAQMFDYYPLLIRTGCALVKVTGVSLSDANAYFQKMPGSLITGTGEKLEVVLGRLVSALEESDGVEAYLLALVVSTGSLKSNRVLMQPPWPTLASLQAYFGYADGDPKKPLPECGDCTAEFWIDLCFGKLYARR
jgi:hypothetical protein